MRILIQEESEYWQQFFAPFHTAVRCPQCGGITQGMEALEPGSPAFDSPNDAGFYRYDNGSDNWMDSADALYEPCWQCNARNVIPTGFVPVTAAEAVAWDAKHGGIAERTRFKQLVAAIRERSGALP
ncbi:MAG: hypothetical protein RBT75_18345 [Anaerolineae bacterium]|nr:hypothetical protein [Anaerolineae bacterium]